MATNYLALNPLLVPEKKVEEIYFKALELWGQGKTMMEYVGEGAEYKYEFVAPVKDILEECNYCLRQQNPGRYGYIATTKKVFRI